MTTTIGSTRPAPARLPGRAARRVPLRGIVSIAGVFALASGLLACRGSTATPTPAPVPSLTTTPVTAVPSPGASEGPSFDPDRTLGPDATRWPDSVVDAVVAIGALDNEIWRANADFIVAAQDEDLALMLGYADGLAELLGEYDGFIERMRGYSVTQAPAEAFAAAVDDLEVAASSLAAAMRAGDGEATTTALKDLGTAMQEYAVAREPIADLANLAIQMKRGQLVK